MSFKIEGELETQVSDCASQAPMILVGCTDPEVPPRCHVVDLSRVLAAANFGLGTCWISKLGFDETLKEVLSISGHMKVLTVTPLGYPAETSGQKARKPLSEIVYYESDTIPNAESN